MARDNRPVSDDPVDAFIDDLLAKAIKSFSSGFSEGIDSRSHARKPVAKKGPTPPPRLYKYLCYDEGQRDAVIDSTLVRRTIIFSRAEDLNDPFEMNPSIRNLFDDRYLKRFLSRRFLYSKMIRTFLNRAVSDPRALIGVPLTPFLYSRLKKRLPLWVDWVDSVYREQSISFIRDLQSVQTSSFSEDPRSPLMWSHYSRSHSGFVIEYDTCDRHFADSLYNSRFSPVRYSHVRPALSVSPDFNLGFGRTKSSHWSYEMEWRLLPLKPEGNKSKIFEVVDRAAIVSVIIGLRMSNEAADDIKQACAQYNPIIPVRRCKMHERDYELIV